MQCFKLVNAGYVDKLIVFNSLPERLLQNIKTRDLAGLPRAWGRWLGEIGSVRPVIKTETIQNPDRSFQFVYTPVGKEPCFYVLEYLDINADKEAWRAISEYIRMNVAPEVRLREKIDDMAIPMAPDPKSALAIEPEDVPVIPVPSDVKAVVTESDLIRPDEVVLVDEPAKKRGRPKKVSVEA